MAEEKYLRQYEKSASGNYLLKSRGILENVITHTADATLTQEESGSLVFVGKTGVDITLPRCKAGLFFRFILNEDNATTACTIVQGHADDELVGALYGSTQGENAATDADVADANANTKISFATGAKRGDFVDVVSDGTVWYCQAWAQNYAGITFEN